MKKIFILIFSLFSISLMAQVMGPKLSLSEKEFDFKDVQQGEKVSHSFQIFNTGDDLLKIERVRASCGCTAAMPEKNELKPGEATTIKVVFNTAGKRGKQKKYVYITTNDSEKRQQRVIFHANVLTNKNNEPSSSARLVLQKVQHNFGTVKEGTILNLNIKLQNNGGKELRIKDVKSSCGCTAALLSKKNLAPNESGNLRIDLDTSGYSGKLTRTVTIISNDTIRPTQTITLFVNVEKRN